jgi:hypothetical protein
MHDILGMLAFFILIGAQFAGVIVVHRWQTENRSTAGGKRTTDLNAPRKLITALSCRDDWFGVKNGPSVPSALSPFYPLIADVMLHWRQT